MDFLVVTGVSGAGKSQVINALEDIGFYCVDNVPPEMMVKFAELCLHTSKIDRYAVVCDVRSNNAMLEIEAALEQVHLLGIKPKLIFLDCDDQTLLRRYKETRRRHPLMGTGEITELIEAVKLERHMLDNARNIADYIIDTSMSSAGQLRERIKSMYLEDASESMSVRILSFGFKYGVPMDADLLFDVRCLPNPYYVPDLKELTGQDVQVRNYVLGFPDSQILLDKLTDLLDFLTPLYIKEGKSQLVVAIGCTGGKHRSVTFVEEIYTQLSKTCGNTGKSHRDIYKK